MDRSFYDVVVEGDQGEHIVFNTLRSSLAVLDEDAYRCYAQLAGDLLETLADAGILVDDAQKEVDDQREWFARDKADRNTLTLCLAPTYQCNFACPYCYEKGQNAPGRMSQDTIAGIAAFVERSFDRIGFERLFIQWYGGEPLLCLDIVESLSRQLMRFCTDRNLAYGAEVITNASLADEEAANTLAQCGITQAMPTLDGCEELHNQRRVCRSGGNSFELVSTGIENLLHAGIEANVAVGLDKRSVGDYRKLKSWAASRNGVEVFPTMVRDYLGCFGEGAFKEPEFDLFTREEFAWMAYELAKESGYGVEAIRSMLSPIRNFCRGQLESYFVIDAFGDAYKCDGRMGYREHSLFNVRDDFDIGAHVTAPYNPLDDPLCRTCRILPLCKGQCTWDRALLDDGCHPFKYTVEAYVGDYRNLFGRAEGAITIFAPPIDLDSFFSSPLKGDGLTLSGFIE